jgi:hypothetical protein
MFITPGIELSGWQKSVVTSVRNLCRILRGEQIAVWGWRRSSGNNELMGREAGALISLEHAIAESVLFS